MTQYTMQDAQTIAAFVRRLMHETETGLTCSGFYNPVHNCKCPMSFIGEYATGNYMDMKLILGPPFFISFIDGFDGVMLDVIDGVERDFAAYSLGDAVYQLLKDEISYKPCYSARS